MVVLQSAVDLSKLIGISASVKELEGLEQLDNDALELLLDEGRERLSQQNARIQFYQETGFRMARTAVIALGILVSAVALLLNQNITKLEIVISQPYLIIGVVMIFISIMFGTLGPVAIDYIIGKRSERINKDYFENLVPEKMENATDKKKIQIRMLQHHNTLSTANRENVRHSQFISILTFYILLIGFSLVAYGIVSVV